MKLITYFLVYVPSFSFLALKIKMHLITKMNSILMFSISEALIKIFHTIFFYYIENSLFENTTREYKFKR